MHSKISSILSERQINHKEIAHSSFSAPINSPLDFANALASQIERISKSVFLRSKKKDKYVMAVCSCNKKFDLKKIAELAGINKLEVADKQDLDDLVGYPITGVSAIGLNPEIAVLIDKSLLDFETILTGSGEIAKEIEINPQDLVMISNATLGDICA
ncbi:YbaK/EbsC family protein [Pedobacter aquatilis]|uniref:aminoacyl-tRNA deacylase n=1 Tax=Pedobacter aquatilis TaxID=351343 RepID=UPI00292FB75E|nr:YbaK/EbsC family protein [Pedobacter aquatilis]